MSVQEGNRYVLKNALFNRDARAIFNVKTWSPHPKTDTWFRRADRANRFDLHNSREPIFAQAGLNWSSCCPSVCLRPNALHQRWPSKGRMPITFNCCAHTTSRGTMSEARGAGTISPRSALLISPYPFSGLFCCNSPDQVYQHGQAWLCVGSTIYQVFIDWRLLVFFRFSLTSFMSSE